MDTDQLMFVEEKETKESSEKVRERCVCENMVKLSPFQPKHMGNVGFIGVHKEKTGKFGARIRDPITKKRVWLGTFNTAEEASKAYLLKKQEFLATLQSVNKPFKGFNFSMDVNKGREPISCVESSCLMASVHGTKSSDRCFYTVTNHPKAKRSLLGIPRRKNGWTANVARDLVRCKKVWLTTSENKSCDQIEPESPVGASLLSVDNDQTVYAASVGTRNERIDSHKTTHIIGAHKKKSGSRYTSEIRNPISKKRVWLGSFDTAEEASQAYQSKKLEFQKLVEAKQQCISKIHTSARADQDGKEKLVRVNSGKEPIVCAESSKEASSLMANVHGTRSSDGCIYSTVTSNPEAKGNLLQIRRQNNGRYAARISDPIMYKKVWLGTSDTVVEDSEAYFSKKSEHEKLSKGNKENKTKNCDQTQPESPVGSSLSMDEDQTLSTAFVGTENNRTDSHRTTHIIGVRKRKSGRYTSEIRNPISKKKIWLGSFVTAEEASQAYQSKKLEFQKLVETKQQHNRQTHYSARAKQDGKEKLVNVKQGHETVNREGFQPKSSCGASGSLEIEVPMSNSSNEGSDQMIESHEISHSLEVHMRKSGKCTSEVLLGTLGTAEEALNAYQCKKPDFERSKKAELQDKIPTDSSAGTNRKCPEDEDLWMGQWVQLPGNREIKFSLKLGVPIIDNYGCLLDDPSKVAQLLGLGGAKDRLHLFEGEFRSNLLILSRVCLSYSITGYSFSDIKVLFNRNLLSPEVMVDETWFSDPQFLHETKVWYPLSKTLAEDAAWELAKLKGIDLAESCVSENKVKSIPFQHYHRGNVTGFVGVQKAKRGKFAAQIRDPITKKKVWLGSFNTAEEASKAYLLNKQEFLATLQSKAKKNLLGIQRRKNGKYAAKISDPFTHKQVWLGTFDTVEDASDAYFSKKSEFLDKLVEVYQGKEPIIHVESSEETSCLMASVHGKKSSDRCIYTVTNHPKARRSLLGTQRQKNGWNADVVRDLVRCKKVWLTTSDTKNCDQIQPVSASLSVDNDRTLNVASVGSKKAIDSQETTHFVGVRKRNSGRYTSEIYNPISKKRLYLGSFDPPEEASQAFQSKKLEIQKLVEEKQQQYNRQTDGKEKLVNSKQDNMPTDSSAGMNRKAQEDEDLWMGQWVQLPGNREINFSLKLGVPIIDNYGSLLDAPSKVAHLLGLDGAKDRLHLFEAELLEEQSFDIVVEGCHCVFHTASPVTPSAKPKEEILDPAVKGTLNVLQSCAKTPSVIKVVMTSSMSAVIFNRNQLSPDVMVDETWLSDPEFLHETKLWYPLSKTLAEDASWKFSKENGIDLITVNPGFVIGPLLQPTLNRSSELLLNIIKGKELSRDGIYWFLDVRDVANAHIRAFEVSSASGRYCLVEITTYSSMVMKTLHKLYPSIIIPEKYKEDFPTVPTFQVSKERAKSLGLNFTSLEIYFEGHC